MNRTVLGVVVLAVLAAGSARPASAQLKSLPVYFSPKGGTGITVAVDYGRGLNDDSGKNSTYTGRVILGLPVVTLGVGVGVFDPKVISQDSEMQFMGNLALKLFGGPLMPVAVSLQGGAGYLKLGSDAFATKSWTFPVGVGLALNIPTPGASLEPWIAGRFQLDRLETSVGNANQTGVGISGGVNLGTLTGVGLHVAADWSSVGEKVTGNPTIDLLTRFRKPLVFGVGLRYMFRLPGLPGVPVVPGV